MPWKVTRLGHFRTVNVRVRVDPHDGEARVVTQGARDGADGDAVIASEDQGNRSGGEGIVDAVGDGGVKRGGVGIAPRVRFADAGRDGRWWGAMRRRGHGELRRVRVAEVVHVPTERTDIVEDPRRSENRGGALDTRAALP
jgi:hypothetical protein